MLSLFAWLGLASPATAPEPLSTPTKPAVKQNQNLGAESTGLIKKFLSCPTETERLQLETDFELRFLDKPAGKAEPLYDWGNFSYVCDFTTTGASRLMTYNTLIFLRDLRFSRPLPFTGSQSLYEYLTLKTISDKSALAPDVLIIQPQTGCAGYSTGGRRGRADGSLALTVNMNGNFSRLYPVVSGSSNCASALSKSGSGRRAELLNQFIYHPIYRSALLVHEAHHAIAGSGHTGAGGNDATIDEMGAWAAQFYYNAWVALYSENTDENTKKLARGSAEQILLSRFSVNRCPTDAKLKTVVDEIKPGLCP